MKKVLFFIESLAGGGAEKVLAEIITHIDKSKFDIAVFTVSDNGRYKKVVEKNCNYSSMLKHEEYKAGGIRKVCYWLMNKFIYTVSPKFVYKYFIKEKYDVEVAFVEGYATKFIANSTNHKSKKIAWVHTDVLQNAYSDRYYHNIKEQINIYKCYKKIICVSDYVRKSFEKKYQILDNTCVIYNPIDIKTIIKKSEESIDLRGNSTLQMVSVGRLVEVKGYMRLLRCINQLQNAEDFNLWIIGDGNQRKEIEKYIENNHLENHVTLVGFTNNPYKYLKNADVFVCSSYAEGFSTAATEALVLEKPVFTVNCSGMIELFGDYKCGEIVENSDYALKTMLTKMINHEYNIESYKDNIRKRVTELNIEQQMCEIEKVIDE